MNSRPWLITVCLTVFAVPASAERDDPGPPRRDPGVTSGDGLFLPNTLPARVGDQRVSAMVLGGWDTVGKGPTTSAFVEGALSNRVALRVGVDTLGLSGDVAVSAGLRVALLRQERHAIDLAVAAGYRSSGLTETGGAR